MDICASSHLNDSVHSRSDVLNMCIYPSVLVGDGYSIPVTNSGHSILPTPHRPLHLNNVLITPNIVKNLIYVRQFVRDNNCTVEFDAFGFSIKDFMTRRVLLRCDSTGDLYPVTKPSTVPHAFLTSQYTWHQSLRHPGSEVLQRILSRNSISCTKEKPPVLCHACQLGKHVRLPFVSSNTLVKSCFDVIHSDLWTSPIPSLSGFKYYCDHGGEFDNHAFHKLFADNGIQFRFSCPRTSEQNEKSKRMIRTINNIIHTLLFQAHLPPNYWVEALNMAIILLNILPSRAIDNEIPFTRLFGTTPEYSVLHGTLSRYKARLVANGSTQIEGVNIDETFSPVVKPGTIRTVLSLAISRHWPVHQLDVKNAFLHEYCFSTSEVLYEGLVQQICLYMHDPREPHFSALKRILRYIRGTLDYGLQLFSSSTTSLVAYSDADWAGCPTTRRTTFGYCVFLGNNLLSCVLATRSNDAFSVPVQGKQRHIEIDIHFVRDLVAAGQVRVLHVSSRYQFADIFTKGLTSALLEEFRTSLSVRCPPALTAGEC
ncbi:ribonuclease H-like domain-containing protein [Tanacetum coccineum]